MSNYMIHKMIKKEIWLIGSGRMACDYGKVLKALECDFSIIGRGVQSAKTCREVTRCEVITGGLFRYLSTKPPIPSHAIVAVGVEKLHDITLQLLDYGVENILVEKPAGLTKQEIEVVCEKSKKANARVFVAYNRRFYASVLKAQEIIFNDGGVSSFNFEFTEWAHVIEKLQLADVVRKKWFLANSTHVIDLAFYLGGNPKELCSFTSSGVDWHPSASVFSGAGISEAGTLFSYQANWEAPGRWSVEVLTKQNRLIFRPLEKLQIQKKGSVQIDIVDVDYQLDEDYKPGLYLQTKNFLDCKWDGFCTIDDQNEAFVKYCKMASYIR